MYTENKTELNEISENSETEVRSVSIVNTTHQPEVIQMINAWATTKLSCYTTVMPDGKFLNHHNEKFDYCDGIIMLASGDICPVFQDSVTCLNPMAMHEDYVSLLTGTIAGTIIPDNSSLNKTVENYNMKLQQKVIEDFKSFGRHAIIAYHSFKQGW